MNDILFGHSYLEDDKTWKYLLNLQIEAMEHIGVAGLVNFFPFLRYVQLITSLERYPFYTPFFQVSAQESESNEIHFGGQRENARDLHGINSSGRGTSAGQQL